VIDYPGTKKDERSGPGDNRVAMIANFLNGAWTIATWEVL